jgi:hypothetical protein
MYTPNGSRRPLHGAIYAQMQRVAERGNKAMQERSRHEFAAVILANDRRARRGAHRSAYLGWPVHRLRFAV